VGEAEFQPAAAAIDSGTAEPVATAAEPAFIEIWRPGRGNRPKHERRTEVRDAHDRRSAPPPAAPQARAPNGATKPAADKRRDRSPRKAGDGRRDASRKPPQAPRPESQRREKPADPDSPFAALAALKAQLEGKGDGS
jgi:ATP-dependent RNA helicase SUPV3L1/SUV3